MLNFLITMLLVVVLLGGSLLDSGHHEGLLHDWALNGIFATILELLLRLGRHLVVLSLLILVLDEIKCVDSKDVAANNEEIVQGNAIVDFRLGAERHAMQRSVELLKLVFILVFIINAEESAHAVHD